MKGIIYSDNKKEIKLCMKEHNLLWKGTREFPQWMNADDKIRGEFVRENGVTVDATLLYQGTGSSGFLDDFTSLLTSLGSEHSDSGEKELSVDVELEIEIRMKTWDIVYRPNVKNMRMSTATCPKGAPEGFIDAAIENYNKNRIKQVETVREEVLKEFGIKDTRTKEEKDKQDVEDLFAY